MSEEKIKQDLKLAFTERFLNWTAEGGLFGTRGQDHTGAELFGKFLQDLEYKNNGLPPFISPEKFREFVEKETAYLPEGEKKNQYQNILNKIYQMSADMDMRFDHNGESINHITFFARLFSNKNLYKDKRFISTNYDTILRNNPTEADTPQTEYSQQSGQDPNTPGVSKSRDPQVNNIPKEARPMTTPSSSSNRAGQAPNLPGQGSQEQLQKPTDRVGGNSKASSALGDNEMGQFSDMPKSDLNIPQSNTSRVADEQITSQSQIESEIEDGSTTQQETDEFIPKKSVRRISQIGSTLRNREKTKKRGQNRITQEQLEQKKRKSSNRTVASNSQQQSVPAPGQPSQPQATKKPKRKGTRIGRRMAYAGGASLLGILGASAPEASGAVLKLFT